MLEEDLQIVQGDGDEGGKPQWCIQLPPRCWQGRAVPEMPGGDTNASPLPRSISLG